MGLDETVSLKYKPPAYVTGELSFGDANAEATFMWIGQELTSEDVSTGADVLTAINLRTSEEDLLQAIQLVFKRSGESPMFSADEARRLLNESIEASEA